MYTCMYYMAQKMISESNPPVLCKIRNSYYPGLVAGISYSYLIFSRLFAEGGVERGDGRCRHLIAHRPCKWQIALKALGAADSGHIGSLARKKKFTPRLLVFPNGSFECRPTSRNGSSWAAGLHTWYLEFRSQLGMRPSNSGRKLSAQLERWE